MAEEKALKEALIKNGKARRDSEDEEDLSSLTYAERMSRRKDYEKKLNL